MASFTDQILGFNPYVQQLPVDAMVKVGMQKQAQYDQGVQKIQSYVDNVAGISVLRPVDKQHLQSKINELGSKLKTVAAGDFSNFQLVNSVGGMVGQVAKDPLVMAAVYSTQNDAKNQAEMEADEKAGKLTPHARYYYDIKRNAYLNNTELKNEEGKPITFSGQYQRSWDLDKNILDAVNAVGDKKYSAEKIFKTDPVSGAILYDIKTAKNPKTGKMEEVGREPILSEFAKQEIKEGKFSENISAAIDGVLSRPEAQQELLMRGVYNYRGYDDVNDFAQEYEREKSKGISLLESKKLEIMQKVLVEKDPEMKKQLQDLVNKTENEISTLAKYEDPRIKQVLETKDLDGYKAMVYTQRQKNNWMESYVTESNTVHYMENVAFEAHRKTINDARAWWATQDASSRGWAAIDISRDNAAFEKYKWKFDPNNPDAPKNQPSPYEKGAIPQEMYANWINAAATANDDYGKSKQQFVIDYMKSVNYANGKTYTDEEVARSAYQYEKDRPGFFDRQFALAKSAVQKNPTNPAFVNLITSLPTINGLEKSVDKYGREVDEINNHPDVIAAAGGVKLSDLETKFRPVTFGNLTLSPKDQINLALAFGSSDNTIKKRADDQLKSSTGKTAFQIAQSYGLVDTQMNNVLQNPYDNFKLTPNRQFTPEQYVVKNNIFKYMVMLNSDVAKVKEKVLQEKMKGNSPLAFQLYAPGAKPADMDETVRRLKDVLADKQVSDEDVSKFAGYYSGTAAEKDAYTLNIGVNRGGAFGGKNEFTLDLYTKDGLEKSLIISKKDADYIKGTVLNVPTPVSDVVQRVTWNSKTKSTNSTTSDPNHPNAYKGAYYKSSEFYSLNRPNLLGADIKVNNLGQPNVYFYVKDGENNSKAIAFKTSPRDILPGAFVSIDHAEKFIKGITTAAQIDNILTNANTK